VGEERKERENSKEGATSSLYKERVRWMRREGRRNVEGER
jgi:hypothetical protein